MENTPDKKTVLVVDDDKEFVTKLVGKIIDAGLHGVGMYTGQEALDYIEKYEVDLIVLDFIMPEMDGYTFYHVMTHDMRKNIPTIILTSMVQTSKETEGLETFVKNQTNIDELVEKIKKYVNSPKNAKV